MEPAEGRAPGTYRRVLVAYDFRSASEAALRLAVRLTSDDRDGAIHLLCVVPAASRMPALDVALASRQAGWTWGQRGAIEERLRAIDVATRARVTREVATGDAAQIVLDRAAQMDAELVVLPRQRDALTGVASLRCLGPILRGAARPVLSVSGEDGEHPA